MSCLAAYTPRPNIYWCPADIYLDPQTQSGQGWEHRVRSVAMDAAVGGGNPVSGPGYKPAASLASLYAGEPNGMMFYATKATQLRNPGPSDSWVFTDEHPDSIDDGILYIAPTQQVLHSESLLNYPPACTMVPTEYPLPTAMRKFINGWIPEPAARGFCTDQHRKIQAGSTWPLTTRIYCGSASIPRTGPD